MPLWNNAPKSHRYLLLASTGCLALSIMTLGVRGGQLSAAKAANDEDFIRFVEVSAEVYNDIRSKYVDEVEGREVLEAALQGMFTRLDEHSQYMDPRTLDSLNKDTGGEFSGIGIHIVMRQGLITVVAPIPGSPSARAGLQPWDRIVEIEGKTSEGLTLQDAVEKLTGPSGTQVKIKVFREGAPETLPFTITRASIKINSVHSKMLENGIGYLRIARFSDRVGADMRRDLQNLKSQGMKALILDLRFNTGGLLREAIQVSDLFVPKGKVVVSTKGRLASQNAEYKSDNDPFINIPTFVLVNEGSASASEIVAGALQDHKLAVLLGPAGKNTFGKGSVQTIEPLRHSMYDDENGNPKESALRLTTARYYTPSGRSIHHVGIKPDIGIPIPPNHDADLLRHGLYGDTIIPMTAEEVKAKEEFERRRKEGTLHVDDTTTQGIELNDPNAPIAADPKKKDDGTPFYAAAKKPEFVKDDFKDIILEEATKQLKIFMILNETRQANTTVASSKQDDSKTVTK